MDRWREGRRRARARWSGPSLRPAVATAVAAALVAALTAIGALLDDTVGDPVQALLLVVPVVVAAVSGGRRVAYGVAVMAALSFSLLLPPIGTPRVHVQHDLVALAAFASVAMGVSALVAGRVDALERIERQQVALLRAVSHDLRTPLATIKAAMSELDEPSVLDAEARRELVTLAGDEADRLDRLVADLLSLARIEGGAFSPRHQAVDLVELVHESADRLHRVLDGLAVHIEGPNPAVVQADHAMLGQVITNLVENAARHSPAGGRLEVVVEMSTGGASIEVRDSGAGVPVADRRSIFEPYRSGALPGSNGIGLATCRAVVEAHGGTITVGDRPGGGAAFLVRLPHG